MDLRDHRLWDPLDGVHHLGADLEDLLRTVEISAGEVTEVVAGGEDRALSSQHHRQRIGSADGNERLGEFAHHPERERIALVGAIEGDGGDLTVAIDTDRRCVHRCRLPTTARARIRAGRPRWTHNTVLHHIVSIDPRYRVGVAPPTQRSLDGAVIAVIGITGGLGSAIAQVLTERGATVIGASRSADSTGSATIALDLRDPEAGTALVEAATSRHGRLDGVINAAGIVAFGDLTDTDDVVIEEVFLTDVLGPLWLIKRVAATLAESKGFILNISAVVAEAPMPSMTAYSAAKAALAAAAVSLRRELRRQNITVIDARPPHTETGLATRPVSGTAPRLADGLDPLRVATRIVEAIETGETEIASTQFT